MRLTVHYSDTAKRRAFARSGVRLADTVTFDPSRLVLEPTTRELLYDTFGTGDSHIPAALMTLEERPESDDEVLVMIHDYRQAQARARARSRRTDTTAVLVFAGVLLLGFVGLLSVGAPWWGAASVMLAVLSGVVFFTV